MALIATASTDSCWKGGTLSFSNFNVNSLTLRACFIKGSFVFFQQSYELLLRSKLGKQTFRFDLAFVERLRFHILRCCCRCFTKEVPWTTWKIWIIIHIWWGKICFLDCGPSVPRIAIQVVVVEIKKSQVFVQALLASLYSLAIIFVREECLFEFFIIVEFVGLKISCCYLGF